MRFSLAPANTKSTLVHEGAWDNDGEEGPSEVAALRAQETPNYGAHKGECATKAQLRSRIEGPERRPQHSREIEDTHKDWQEVEA